MTPLFADAINIPMVLVAGLIILVPLMAFEIFVEAFVLKKLWRLRYGELCTLAFIANGWSLLAGIPIKILNVFIYERLLPQDIPGFFAGYARAAALGAFIYFAVSVLVEGAWASVWNRWKQIGLSQRQIWMGMLVANISTYVVLAPLHYYVTKPRTQIQEFRTDTKWTAHPTDRVLFVDELDSNLKSVRLDGTGAITVVPFPTTDYLVSSNLEICVFRGTNGNLYFHKVGTSQPELIWQTDERFLMRQVAFSPSGKSVAFASKKQNGVDVLDRSTGRRKHLPLAQKFDFSDPSVAWSIDESRFYVGGLENKLRLVITLRPDGTVDTNSLDGTNAPTVLTCYGRIGSGSWWGGDDWGVSYSDDECGDLRAMAWPGLDSGLWISRSHGKESHRILGVSVRPGLLHLAQFYFGDVAFIEGCDECLFEANGYIYLLDIPGKRLGTLTKGERFVRLMPRYQKSL
ncbi:MAG: hypothetical protein ACTHLW_15035 [Verrucomicrobiota bacterium]